MGTSKKGNRPKASKNDPGYTDRKRLFVDAYCGPAANNATKAAEMTGYAPGSIGKLLADPWVLRAIEQGKEEKRKEFAVEAQALVQYYAKGMYLDPIEYVVLFEGGKISRENLLKVPADVRQFMHIKKWKPVLLGYMGEGEDKEPIIDYECEFTFVDKLKCAENLTKICGLYKEGEKPKNVEVDQQVIIELLKERKPATNVLDAQATITQILGPPLAAKE